MGHSHVCSTELSPKPGAVVRRAETPPAGRVTAPLPDLSGEETASPQLQGFGGRQGRKQWESQRTAPLPCRHLGDWVPAELLCLPTFPGLG